MHRHLPSGSLVDRRVPISPQDKGLPCTFVAERPARTNRLCSEGRVGALNEAALCLEV